MKFRYLLLVILFLTYCEIKPQTIGLNFTTAIPSGEFKESMNKTGFGGSIHATIWDTSPIMPATLGLNVGYFNFGSESRNTRISSDIPDVTVDVDRTYNFVNFHILFQVSPFSGPFKPYVEGLFGGSYLYTETKINSENTDKEVASSVNFDDYAWSYGGGGGFLIRLVENLEGDNEDDNNNPKLGGLWLDLKARYLFGSEAEYLKKGAVRVTNGKVLYDPSKSKTDLFTLHLGVVLSFR